MQIIIVLLIFLLSVGVHAKSCKEIENEMSLKKIDAFILRNADSTCIDRLIVKREAMIDRLVASAKIELIKSKHRYYNRDDNSTIGLMVAEGLASGAFFWAGYSMAELSTFASVTFYTAGVALAIIPIFLAVKYTSMGETELEKKQREQLERCVERRVCY